MQNNILNNYAFQSVSDKGKTQAPLHSRFARVGEYPFNGSALAGLHPNSLSANFVKLNIKLNSVPNLVGGEKLNKMEETKWKTF